MDTQVTSYELQVQNYTEMITGNDDWELVDIYADEGISGTSLKHRDNFNRMIADCKEGKIDLIITKAINRFARNILDCISTIRIEAIFGITQNTITEVATPVADHIKIVKIEGDN